MFERGLKVCEYRLKCRGRILGVYWKFELYTVSFKDLKDKFESDECIRD